MVLSNLAGFLRRSIVAACFGPMTASDVVGRPMPLAGANAEAGTITMATARARAATSVLADNITRRNSYLASLGVELGGALRVEECIDELMNSRWTMPMDRGAIRVHPSFFPPSAIQSSYHSSSCMGAIACKACNGSWNQRVSLH